MGVSMCISVHVCVCVCSRCKNKNEDIFKVNENQMKTLSEM